MRSLRAKHTGVSEMRSPKNLHLCSNLMQRTMKNRFNLPCDRSFPQYRTRTRRCILTQVQGWVKMFFIDTSQVQSSLGIPIDSYPYLEPNGAKLKSGVAATSSI